MTNKQQEEAIETASQPYNALQLYNTTGVLSQYIVYNLFRILRPIRKKFNLTINEIVILNGMMLYHKYEGSSFSYSAILRYVGYFNDKKMRYYFGSLQEKNCIMLSDILNGAKRYRLTEKGIEAVRNMEESYDKSLYEFLNSYSISL
jgi:predicted transcriptional regulator